MSQPDQILFQQLQQQLQQHQGRGLWVLDENLAQFAPAGHRNDLQLLSNRFDIQQSMSADGWQIRFSDFDFSSEPDDSLDRIYYRVSKEKAVVHQVINQALRCLKPGGELLLFGAKNEGTRTYFDKARKLFGHGELLKAGKGVFTGILIAGDGPHSEPLDDRDYQRLRPVAELEGREILSKPGVFGWDKLDAGSIFLADNLAEVRGRLGQQPPRVLDLGCGYGYLSLRAWQQGAAEVIATDNNAAAVIACRDNFARHQLCGEVIADNCAGSLSDRFDLIVCNPPFHQGFSVEGELTDRFLGSTARLLDRSGQAAFVVNRFIGLERKAQGLFAEVETFADNGSFKLVRLAGPIR